LPAFASGRRFTYSIPNTPSVAKFDVVQRSLATGICRVIKSESFIAAESLAAIKAD